MITSCLYAGKKGGKYGLYYECVSDNNTDPHQFGTWNIH